MRYLIYTVLIWACWSYNPGQLKGQQIPLRHLGVEDGLPTSSVYMVMEDQKGYMWFATSEGVARFDGYTFKTFTVKDGLPNNDIYKVSEDSQGRIWAFSKANGVTFIQGDSVFYLAINHDAQINLNSIAQDQQGKFWMSGHAGGMVWDGKELKLLGSPTNRHQDREYLLKEREGVDWYIWGSKLERLDANGFQTVYEIETVYAWVLVSPEGRCLIMDLNQNYYLINPKEGVFCTLSVEDLLGENKNGPLGQGPGIHRTQSSVFYTDEGNLLLDENYELWIPPDPIDGKVTNYGLRDKAGNAWYCMEGQGVWLESAHAKWIRNLDVQDGLSHKQITSLMGTPAGALVLGTDNGDLNVFRNGKITSITQTPMRRRVTAICMRSGNRILIGGRMGIGSGKLEEDRHTTAINWYNPLVRFDSRYLRELYERDQQYYVGASIKNIMLDGPSKTYLVGHAGIFVEQELQDDSLKYTHFDSGQVLDLVKGPNRTIYEGTTNGLKQKAIENLAESHEFEAMQGKFITSLINIADTLLAIGTDGDGLYIRFRDHFFAIPELQERSIRDIVFYQPGPELWIATDQGAWVMRPHATRPLAYSLQVISKAAGILSREINTILPTDTAIYLATNAGLSIVDRQYLQRKETPAPIHLTQVRIEGEVRSLQKQYELDHNENDLEIEFVGLTYAEKGTQRYAYRLQGVDRKWRKTRELNASYPKLSPGKYRFEVMLINDRALPMSATASLEFTIHPYWADTWIFRIAFVLGLLLLMGTGLKLRYNFVNKRNRLASENALQMLELEAKALNAQMNPHFIFNSLNAMQYLMNAGEKDKANIYLASFGKLIRLNLEASEKNTISLQEELDRLQFYMSLESLRLPDLISSYIEVAAGIHAQEIQVPCMILQPFVENAIWHGILPARRPGTVHISIAPQGAEQVSIIIRDDGIGIEQSRLRNQRGHTSKGIELVRRRLEYAQPNQDQPVLRILELKSEEGKSLGTQVEIFLGLPITSA